MGKTSPAVKKRYNSKSYRRYEFSVRFDDELYEQIEKYKIENKDGLSKLIIGLLREYFKNIQNND